VGLISFSTIGFVVSLLGVMAGGARGAGCCGCVHPLGRSPCQFAGRR
jgi:hypothetical protein